MVQGRSLRNAPPPTARVVCLSRQFKSTCPYRSSAALRDIPTFSSTPTRRQGTRVFSFRCIRSGCYRRSLVRLSRGHRTCPDLSQLCFVLVTLNTSHEPYVAGVRSLPAPGVADNGCLVLWIACIASAQRYSGFFLRRILCSRFSGRYLRVFVLLIAPPNSGVGVSYTKKRSSILVGGRPSAECVIANGLPRDLSMAPTGQSQSSFSPTAKEDGFHGTLPGSAGGVRSILAALLVLSGRWSGCGRRPNGAVLPQQESITDCFAQVIEVARRP